MYNNVRLAERRFPDCFSEKGMPVIFKNTVQLHLLFTGKFVYVPQNAWAWHGPTKTPRELFRRTTLRILSDFARLRANRIVRIGPMIPASRNCADRFLPNTLDESFEDAWGKARKMDRPPWTPKGDYFIAPGSYWSYRNLEFLVDSYRKYATKHKDPIQLVVVGPATQKKYFDKIKTLCEDTKNIKLIGRKVQREELLSAMNHSTACIFPSLVEASPVTVLEAAVAGLPIIASETAAHRYIEDHLGGTKINFYSDSQGLQHLLGNVPNATFSLLSDQKHRKQQREQWGEMLLSLCMDVSF